MLKVLRVLACPSVLVAAGSAFAAGYTCDADRKYTSCFGGYYLSDCGTKRDGSSVTPTLGNSCESCPANHTCAGGTACPASSNVTITFNLNSGSGTAPAAASVAKGASYSNLPSGDTTTFYRGGYVFDGWSTTSGANNSAGKVTSVTPSANITLYAIWTPCAAGSYKATTAKANAACTKCGTGTYQAGTGMTSCTSCPSLDTNFFYATTTGMTAWSQCVETGNIGTGCSQGIIQKTASSASAWGALTEKTAVKAKAGYYVNDSKVCEICPTGYYSTGGAITSCTACGLGTYAASSGSTSCTSCPSVPTGGSIIAPATAGTSWSQCVYERSATGCATGTMEYTASSASAWGSPTTGATWSAPAGYRVSATGCEICRGATWSTGGISKTCATCISGYTYDLTDGKSSSGQCQIYCEGGYRLAAAKATTCSPVGTGYWIAGHAVPYGTTDVTGASCTGGTTTIGYGPGADEAADCGRILHVGTRDIYLRNVKKTSPSLAVNIGGNTFYGNLTTESVTGSLKVNNGSTTYSVCDDTFCPTVTGMTLPAGDGMTGIMMSPNVEYVEQGDDAYPVFDFVM